MPYPIKYIENNLVWNIEGECFAYYELIPFNYSFLSLEQKDAVHDAFRQLIAQNRDGKIHALQISTESSIRAAQERSKKSVTGRLKRSLAPRLTSRRKISLLRSVIHRVDYRFFLGFKLVVTDKELLSRKWERPQRTCCMTWQMLLVIRSWVILFPCQMMKFVGIFAWKS